MKERKIGGAALRVPRVMASFGFACFAADLRRYSSVLRCKIMRSIQAIL
jgi:hypothetical protein